LRRVRGWPGTVARRLRRPRTTVRWRLTLLYGSLFLVSGVILLGITYTLVARDQLPGKFGGLLHFVVRPRERVLAGNNPQVQVRSSGFSSAGGVAQANPTQKQAGVKLPPPSEAFPPLVKRLLGSTKGRQAVRYVGTNQRTADLHQLLIESAIALAIMAVICMALGWVIAGRVLRPLRTITATTREISAASLDRRLAMSGPPDELRGLADTIDGLLGRLEGSFEAQRRFVANASHELRTPLAASRAMLEMVVDDADATTETFRTTCLQVLEEGERQEQLIGALLALARGQRGIEQPEPVDLRAVVEATVAGARPHAVLAGVTIATELEPAILDGDRRLVERLVSNLIDNAIRHNLAAGSVTVTASGGADGAVLTVTNTGPPIPAAEIDRLLQPFQRMAAARVGQGDGFGLGLSIVAAVAAAHHAELAVLPGDPGGLRVSVRFPAASLVRPLDDPAADAVPAPASVS
jgi:signal transduction histidine kinase